MRGLRGLEGDILDALYRKNRGAENEGGGDTGGGARVEHLGRNGEEDLMVNKPV